MDEEGHEPGVEDDEGAGGLHSPSSKGGYRPPALCGPPSSSMGDSRPPALYGPPPDPIPHSPVRKRRSWRAKFAAAFRGLKLGVRGHSSFFVHFFFTALVLAAALVLECELTQWCMLVGCIGLVLTAELFNSAIETLFAGLDEQTKERAWPALDIAAGAVLLASITASVVGLIVFLKPLISYLR